MVEIGDQATLVDGLKYNQAPAASRASAKLNKSNRRMESVKHNDSGKLLIGPFHISPAVGVVQAGLSHTVTIECHPEASKRFHEIISVDIADRNPQIDPTGVEYELLSDACIPGIDNTDFKSIFEEYTVATRHSVLDQQKNVFAEEERVFQMSPVAVGKQVSARIRISNPFKVNCDVNLAMRRKGGNSGPMPSSNSNGSGVGSGGLPNELSFDVEPKKLLIPCHKSAFATITFQPNSIQTFMGTFEAVVENGEGTNKMLTFDVRGEGTLPRVSIINNSGAPFTGSHFLSFRRLLLNRRESQPLTLRNHGLLPATVCIDISQGTDNTTEGPFSCASTGVPVVIHPAQHYTFLINFQPTTVNSFTGSVNFTIEDNPFESGSVDLMGSGFEQDVTLENVPEETSSDVRTCLRFNDCQVGKTHTLTFDLVNNANQTSSFCWNLNGHNTFLEVCPSQGHLKPGASCPTVVSYRPSEPQKLQKGKTLLDLKLSKIKYSEPLDEVPEWNSQVHAVTWDHNSTETTEPEREPRHEVLESDYTQVSVEVRGCADYVRYECDLNNIHFKQTLMYQTRAFKFPLTNTGTVGLDYKWRLLLPPNAEQEDIDFEDCPFSVTPEQARLAIGETVEVTVRFSPLDSGDYSGWGLELCIPNAVAMDTHAAERSASPFTIQFGDGQGCIGRRTTVHLAFHHLAGVGISEEGFSSVKLGLDAQDDLLADFRLSGIDGLPG